MRLPAWLHRKVIPPKPLEGGLRAYLDQFLDASVLWFLFGVLIAISGAMLGFSLAPSTPSGTNGGSRTDSNFYNFMSQTFMTILACYCTLLPVLHAHLNKRVGFQLGSVAIVVFYITVCVALVTAVAAPIVYVKAGTASAQNISNALGFASSVCSVVTASQLAAGVLELGRPGRER